ncbi:B3 DNA binding domain [Dillenia turbinata]|uniref:B3 DNA binding domain n=1 Tax=Dillenia turbinata TaxID=194707 RepID=A0AAN8ZTD0_9MAGN
MYSSKACPGTVHDIPQQNLLIDAFPTFLCGEGGGFEQKKLTKPRANAKLSVKFEEDFPSKFTQKFMPREGATILLEDEDGNEYPTSYEVKHLGLSAGWAAFAEHNLQVGDALVFHLIMPHKFKWDIVMILNLILLIHNLVQVYIVRADQLSQVDGALALMSLSAQAR